MGLIIDTGVLIRLERKPAAVDFSAYKPAYGEGFISAATCSELLVGVHLANTDARAGLVARRSWNRSSSCFNRCLSTLKLRASTRTSSVRSDEV